MGWVVPRWRHVQEEIAAVVVVACPAAVVAVVAQQTVQVTYLVVVGPAVDAEVEAHQEPF